MEKTKLFDTHTHYDDRAYGDDADCLIKKMLADNVAGFIAVGCNPKRNRLAAEIAQRHTNAYAAVGIHPGDVKGLQKNYLSQLESVAGSKKVKAIGEAGLDYHYEGYDKEKQHAVFEEQLQLAQRINLPIIIHSRDALSDTMELLRKYRPRAVMHCYSQDAKTVAELIEMGIMVSFTGVLTFKKAQKAVDACKAVPLEMLMLETDCPYMAPEPFRGKLCDSSMAWYTAEKIAEIKGVKTETVVKICNGNAKRFFNIEF